MKTNFLRTVLLLGAMGVALGCGPQPDSKNPFTDRTKTSVPPAAPPQDTQVGNCANCSPPSNGTDQALGECSNGEALCVTAGTTSYCANLTNDATNCGACGNFCQNDTGCFEGVCR